MRTLEQIRTDLQEIHAKTKSWEQAGKRYGINKAMARLIAGGYKPGAKIRKVLELPEMLPAPACPRCGVVHVTSRCPATRKPATRWADMPLRDVRRAIENRVEV